MQNLQELYMEQLRDVYDAEHQLLEALPILARAAGTEDLTQAFERHLVHTQQHIQRLQQVFDYVGTEPRRKTCAAMQGLLYEAREIIQQSGDPHTRDAALIAAAQRIEHYEIAAYGTLSAYADELAHSDAHTLLQETLNEEKNMDQALTALALTSINQSARVEIGTRSPHANDF